ncbi:uncharacterized protein DSM5745_09103 [Aspergillus mulundensis]|uniref:Uncharacterized protein n=1 Tax=Aspergillus mulundensis TaxID=1810919 RepID=A0A3D8QZP0_9EURO|nr:Uncharacterized protein DSM5745_09103 [Aspergillus mulundensis]RDW67237.1 Uncharacterized protein DSM5745_09103 [Aspergillus mulundensis]
MSTTTSTSAAATCTGNAWVLPVQDIACAVRSTSGNYSSIMDKCCGVADVESYNDDCGLYCLAQEQSGDDLLKCIQDNGAGDSDVFCGGGNLTQTATAAVPSSTGGSDDGNATSTGDAAEPSDTGNAAPALVAAPVSKAGLGVLGMLFASVVLGVVV